MLLILYISCVQQNSGLSCFIALIKWSQDELFNSGLLIANGPDFHDFFTICRRFSIILTYKSAGLVFNKSVYFKI